MITKIKLLLAGALLSTSLAYAAVDEIPVVGAIYNSSLVVKEHIVKDISLSTVIARDASIYTFAGLTLDAYILTLPLKTKVKKNVIKRLAYPEYSITLGRFLYHFYQRYTGSSNVELFNDYIQSVYSEAEMAQYQHSLFSSIEKTAVIKPEQEQESIVNDELIAALVTIYDILFNNDDWQLGKKLPDSYQYITNSPKDLKIVNKIQPIIISLMAKYNQSLPAGDFKSAINAIINDAKPEFINTVNNKAQAITVTLIDFIRLNTLKSYRQFSLKQQRIDAFDRWMIKQFKHQPDNLIEFLNAQNQKRYGVQIVVDGLQQGLVKALVKEQRGPFINQVQSNLKQSKQYQPKFEPTFPPEHNQQLDYLNSLSSGKDSDSNYLPFFKSLYQQHAANIAEFGISSTPTISVRNLPVVLTGAKVAGQGGTGIPNFHFVDRTKDRAYYFFGNDALQLDKLIAENQVQTMFDRLNYLKTLNCNGQYDWNAHVSYDGLVNLAAGEFKRDYGEQRCLRELGQRAKVEQQVFAARNELIKLIGEYQKISAWMFLSKITKKQLVKEKIHLLAKLAEDGMPDFVSMYIPWPDHFAHFKGPFSDEIIAPTGELNRLDYWLTQLQKTYKRAGVYNKTLWGMAGDHGLAQVFYTLNPEQQVLNNLEKELNVSLNIVKISSDEGEGPKITNAINYPSSKNVDVVVASTAGGNYMMDFFNSSKGWQQQPLYSELQQWQPISTSTIAPIAMISEISNRLKESLDYLAVREQQCDLSQCKIRIVGHRNNKRLDEIIIREDDRVFYGFADNLLEMSVQTLPQLLDIQQQNPYTKALTRIEQAEKQQLLKQCLISANQHNSDSWCTSSQWRQLTRLSPRPDSVNQLAHIYDEDRAGTVNLFPQEGIGYNTSVPGRHAGEHYLEKDAFIGFWGTPITSRKQITTAENGSLAPTIFEYLSGNKVQAGENGWGFPSLLPQLIPAQLPSSQQVSRTVN
ncbi:alkaline phosphatase family protein [Thalassotalea fonticola]|uniref:Alkaline phosphatase family protein n=1 Tax=Thalassotalea fonticola TaxID=3065649 RepID=A0ABZ0GK32_9GAMM|nr:alkaline phosphatase family protein [Colwelliaceae bacterium S1-1]